MYPDFVDTLYVMHALSYFTHASHAFCIYSWKLFHQNTSTFQRAEATFSEKAVLNRMECRSKLKSILPKAVVQSLAHFIVLHLTFKSRDRVAAGIKNHVC